MKAIDNRITDLFDAAEASLARCRVLFPLVYDHAHRNDGLPARSAEVTSADPTIRLERNPEPLDKRALRFVLDTLRRIALLEQILSERVPALEAQLRGKKLSQQAPIGSRPIADGTCIVCEQVASKLVRGMCDTDYRAFVRAGRPDIGTWIPKRRSETAKS